MWLAPEQGSPPGPTQVCNSFPPNPRFRVTRSVPHWEAGKKETESLQRKVQSPPTRSPALKEEGGPRHKGDTGLISPGDGGLAIPTVP